MRALELISKGMLECWKRRLLTRLGKCPKWNFSKESGYKEHKGGGTGILEGLIGCDGPCGTVRMVIERIGQWLVVGMKVLSA